MGGLGDTTAMTPGQKQGYIMGATAYGTQAAMTLAAGPGNLKQNLVLSAPAITGAVVTSAAAMGASWASAAIPFVGPAIAGITIALQLLFARGQHKVQATKIVDTIEPKMKENLAAYQASPRTEIAKAQALANFDAMWQAVLEGCGQSQLGAAGKACISDRQRGGKWDWFSYYRDPIENDPVQPEPVVDPNTGNIVDPKTGAVLTYADGTPGGGFNLSGNIPLLLGAGVLFLALAM